ncbi:P-loop NTPase family protein [Thermosynechococcaceae cyanobacterium BACA0444]|uniref:P-loop NTPase family protein n=1 Tax=Pseudocalidococcus azoricus BACA0444 TaxID=2918990 RepID=A0AAE4JYG9_9CYAN|nr:P-loop NTPase family protein [Pseudocalidococcus azoricus]MDS3859692.1 P-loop NTPase family protein [Pseudocalidococcus azoricus BACA0444]
MVSQLVELRPRSDAPVQAKGQPPYCVEGLIQIFTAHHRSFFTTVMAQALTIAGQGTPVLVVQFLKGGINLGVARPMTLGQHLDWVRCNVQRCLHQNDLSESEVKALAELWEFTQQAIRHSQYSLVVLDELSLAVHLGLIPEAAVINLLENRPRQLDIILTGPAVSPRLLELADQVTELRRTYRT